MFIYTSVNERGAASHAHTHSLRRSSRHRTLPLFIVGYKVYLRTARAYKWDHQYKVAESRSIRKKFEQRKLSNCFMEICYPVSFFTVVDNSSKTVLNYEVCLTQMSLRFEFDSRRLHEKEWNVIRFPYWPPILHAYIINPL